MFQKVKVTPKKRRLAVTDYYHREPKRRICTFDTETDPFAEGRVVEPFCCGFHIIDSGEYYDFWGDDCIAQFFAFLDANFSEEPLCIYVHNGGNFDFYFMCDYFDAGSSPFIINGRLVRVDMHGQEFRDSYAAVPVALEKYQKTSVDYTLFERPVREANKATILSYMKDDCVYLGELISAWLTDFGDKLTMASVALPKLMERHGIELMNEDTDARFRPYYFGGRVQCFETGLLEDDWIIYDVNSMYPSVMRSYQHPVSRNPIPQSTINEKTAFARIIASSDGALPVRNDHGGLDFPRVTKGEFMAGIHEINVGIETGLLTVKKVIEAWRFDAYTCFDDFVDYFYSKRMEARETGDKIHDIFYKLVQNSSYGKLAQDPRKYENFVWDPGEPPTPTLCTMCMGRGLAIGTCQNCIEERTAADGWYIHTVRGDKFIWARPQQRRGNNGFFNVATAASITGAARAELLRAIHGAERPIYCDTDSLICRSLGSGVRLDDDALGAWKVEGAGRFAAIAGKKLYAVYDSLDDVRKIASKGVRLTAEQIMRVSQGEVVEYANPVPKFGLDGSAKFVTRKISKTG